MLRKPFFILCLLLLTAIDVPGANALVAQDTAGKAQSKHSGAWSARSTSNLTLMGTWTAVPDSTGRTVLGSWTLTDPQGRTLAGGGWSAAKAPTGWSGAWRAIVAGRSGEYAGTWTATDSLKPDAGFADLFEKAIERVVSGTWRYGSQSGAWSIRAAKSEKTPDGASGAPSRI